jgi:NTE family protein
MKKFIFSFLLIIAALSGFSQKVGLVLSGGGARGLAHIGVIRALEANHIPIDYIAGTSMGAIIAGLYASGYSADEMEELFRSENFHFWSTGKIQEKYRFYFKQPEENPAWINLMMEKRKDKLKLLPPTNIIPQWQMDFTFMEMMAATNAVCHNDFDRLFVPFRCVATEVYHNKQVVLSKGDLGEAIRASMTFPFYFKPIEIDGELLYDGGIVNNFPTDVMKKIFNPDIIIGHNVADSPEPAEADDIIRQIYTMIQRPTNYAIPSEDGILLKTDVPEVGTLDFQKLDEVVKAGEKTAASLIDSIKSRIKRRVDPDNLARKREAFHAREPALLFQNIQVEGVKDPLQQKYIINSLKHNKNILTIDVFRKEYFKLLTDQQIKSIRPQAVFNYESGYFDVILKVEPEKKAEINIGGNISTKPINQGYVDFRYRFFKDRSYSLSSNLYFGRFYSSYKLGGRVDFPTTKPFYFASYLTYNRWDFFSTSTQLFFEDVRPPYIIQNETNFRNEIGFPLGLHNKMSLGAAWSGSQDVYYQIEKYNKSDEPDKTNFNAFITHLDFEKNTLNQKQYASEGSFRSVSAGFITGLEKNIPGTTSENLLITRQNHNYFLLRGITEKYFPINRKLIAGTRLEALFSNKKPFSNYTSTLLAAPGFYPTPHSKTLFIENFHANNYLAGGIKGIIHLNSQIHFRMEGYGFLPLHEMIKTTDRKAEPDDRLITDIHYQAMAAFVYETGLGPVSLVLNYYDKTNTKWYLTLNFGYNLFNKRGF